MSSQPFVTYRGRHATVGPPVAREVRALLDGFVLSLLLIF
jgi:hypothetical protein